MSDLRALALSSHIFVHDADAAGAFYREVFGATELFRNRLPGPDEIARRIPPDAISREE